MTGFAFAGCRHCFIAIGAVHGKRNDLHGRDHFAFDHRLEGRQRRYGDRFIDAVERVDRFLSTTRTPALSANRLQRP